MTDLIKKSLAKKIKVRVFPIYEYWSDIGTSKDLKNANNFFVNTSKI